MFSDIINNEPAFKVSIRHKIVRKKKDDAEIIIININNGLIHFFKDIPADLIAISSFFSAIFPKVIIEDSNTEIGSAIGTNLAAA